MFRFGVWVFVLDFVWDLGLGLDLVDGFGGLMWFRCSLGWFEFGLGLTSGLVFGLGLDLYLGFDFRVLFSVCELRFCFMFGVYD